MLLETPPHHLIKVNVDGVVSFKHSLSTIRIVVKDWQGRMCVARVSLIDKMLRPLTTELLAIREALLWCLNAGFN